MDDLERLYKTHYAAVVRFLYRKIWDADRAGDLAQEVFIRAMAHQPEKPRAWIFAVAANLAAQINGEMRPGGGSIFSFTVPLLLKSISRGEFR